MQDEFERENAIQAIRMCESNGLTGTAAAIREIMAGLSRVGKVSEKPQFSDVAVAQETD